MATETTLTSARAWAPDLQAFAPRDVVNDAIIMQASTIAGSVEGDQPAVRVAFVDDAAATFTAEGADIAESDPTLDEVLVYTAKITQLVKLSREQWTQANTATELSESVRRAVTKKANEAFLTQAAPTSPAVTPPAGLINIAGIEDGGAVADDLDGLIDLIAALEDNGGNPSHIIVSPTSWASLRKFKTGTASAQSLLGAGTNDAERRLLDLPVLVSSAMTGGNGVVVDKSAVASAVGQVMVGSSEHVYFNSDNIALRCTWRLGWNVVHPDRIGKFSVTAPTEA
ncbi:phage major capsid protein [Paramicrobacterium chengjingii]|uniref:Phage major capsid protein n=1 Tax=Paramicrobacterium chengjingii TaxID=2769067 RepID=A0ABX6YL67_9MICO|nr:phage major capsid protein [Microbacterium chengjingii]QPZ39532.1 phage major capsid protein [Microbacterium chengjingii]